MKQFPLNRIGISICALKAKAAAPAAALFLCICSFVVLQASQQVFIPKSEPDLSKVPAFTSNLLKEERTEREIEEQKNIEHIVKNIVKSSDKQLERQADQILQDKEKLEKLLTTFSSRDAKKDNSKNQANLVSKEMKKLLDSFYKDENLLKKKISVKLKGADVREAIELIGRTAELDFIIDPAVFGTVNNINLKKVSVGSALNIVLSGNRPRLALIKDLGVWRILTLQDAIYVLRGLTEDLRQKGLISDFMTIQNAKWNESFKLRVEKMWDGIIGDYANKQKYYLVFDDNTRKIFFKSQKSIVADFKNFLQEIDLRIPQVKIEARVIIASKDFEESFGLQLSGIYNRSSSVSKAGLSWVGFGDIKSEKGSANIPGGIDWALNLLPQAASKFLNFPFVFGGRDLDTKRLNLVLNAAENRNEIETLLKPSLLVNSEEVAEILVGQEVPIETSVQERIEGSLRDINTISYKDLGMKLKVKPVVAPDQRSVFMDIFVENSFVKDNNSSFDAKKSIIVTTKTKNRVLLKSGQTTLIGGLISNDKRISKSGVPLLQDIPLLGALFRGSKRTKKDDQLMIFISPTVV